MTSYKEKLTVIKMLPVIAFLLIVAVSAEIDIDDDCKLKPETGLCQAYFANYFFNSTTGQCEQFVYGGCGGNANNFQSRRQCEIVCRPQAARDCYADVETGMCQAIIPRFFYDRVTRQCKSFIYGGCGGNNNNFETYEECHDECGALPPRVGPDCSSPAETGLCKAYFPRFFFNSNNGRCEKFIYGGCGGNDNSYDTEDDCQKACGSVKEEEVDCDAEAETGLCRGAFPMYYYNRAEGSCQEFIYGGCGGNSNRFGSEEECLNKCHVKKSKKDIRQLVDCESEPETGFCRAYIPSFYFDKSTGTCERFIYGGCGGNGNRFQSHEDCHSVCSE